MYSSSVNCTIFRSDNSTTCRFGVVPGAVTGVQLELLKRLLGFIDNKAFSRDTNATSWLMGGSKICMNAPDKTVYLLWPLVHDYVTGGDHGG